MPLDVMVADYGLCTALGPDVATAWPRLLAGESALARNPRLQDRRPDMTCPSAVCPGIGYAPTSLAMQMLAPLLKPLAERLPPDTLLLLATTVGEVDLLEQALLDADGDPDAGRLDRWLPRVAAMLGLARPGAIVSAACASSSMALALGASLIRSGREAEVIVVGCDAVTEFVLAGFASLMALAPDPARPFDRQRQGLSLGEAAGWCWLRAAPAVGTRPGTARGRLRGWSCRADAHHMTAPAPQGDGLVAAIADALRMAGATPAELGAICAHGTGTRHNDEMEMNAFARILAPDPACPIFSIKGQIGHTLGAAGLAEAVFALEAVRSGSVPPTVGCGEPEPAAMPVTRGRTPIARPIILSTNSGFGGINTALVLDGHVPGGAGQDATERRVAVAGLAWANAAELGVAAPGRTTRLPLPAMDQPDRFFPGGYPNWGRVGSPARRLACVLELAFRELRLGAGAGRPSAWGILGLNATGCHDENRAFFRDYLEHGRSLARGALFVQTLPSTPVAEASIHFGLRGPAGHLVDPDLDFSRAADWCCALIAEGDAPGLILAALADDRVWCAFLQAAAGPGAKAGLGWAADFVRSLPQAGPGAWLDRCREMAQGEEGTG